MNENCYRKTTRNDIIESFLSIKKNLPLFLDDNFHFHVQCSMWWTMSDDIDEVIKRLKSHRMAMTHSISSVTHWFLFDRKKKHTTSLRVKVFSALFWHIETNFASCHWMCSWCLLVYYFFLCDCSTLVFLVSIKCDYFLCTSLNVWLMNASEGEKANTNSCHRSQTKRKKSRTENLLWILLGTRASSNQGKQPAQESIESTTCLSSCLNWTNQSNCNDSIAKWTAKNERATSRIKYKARVRERRKM